MSINRSSGPGLKPDGQRFIWSRGLASRNAQLCSIKTRSQCWRTETVNAAESRRRRRRHFSRNRPPVSAGGKIQTGGQWPASAAKQRSTGSRPDGYGANLVRTGRLRPHSTDRHEQQLKYRTTELRPRRDMDSVSWRRQIIIHLPPVSPYARSTS